MIVVHAPILTLPFHPAGRQVFVCCVDFNILATVKKMGGWVGGWVGERVTVPLTGIGPTSSGAKGANDILSSYTHPHASVKWQNFNVWKLSKPAGHIKECTTSAAKSRGGRSYYFICCIYRSNCVLYYHFLWLERESSWLPCLPQYQTLPHTHMSLLINTSPSLHCLCSTVRILGRLRHRMVQHR